MLASTDTNLPSPPAVPQMSDTTFSTDSSDVSFTSDISATTDTTTMTSTTLASDAPLLTPTGSPFSLSGFGSPDLLDYPYRYLYMEHWMLPPMYIERPGSPTSSIAATCGSSVAALPRRRASREFCVGKARRSPAVATAIALRVARKQAAKAAIRAFAQAIAKVAAEKKEQRIILARTLAAVN